jgi:uncharacterized membrane protein
MPVIVRLYLPALVVFLALDAVWLGLVARGFYRDQLGPLMRPDVNWGAALLFYFLFMVGLLVFVVAPALERQSLARAAGLGALFGLICYATYDLTNLATLRGFPAIVAAVDLAWGAVIAAATASAAFLLAGPLGAR